MCMMLSLHVCLCIMHMLGSCGGQKKISDPLELESQTVVSCHVGAEN